MLCSNQSAYGFNYFYPVIVQGFGLGSRTITLVCTAPAYLVGAAVSFGVAWHSDRKGERGLHVAIPMCVAVVGFVISIAVLNVPARYVASFLYVSGCFSASAVLYSSVANRAVAKVDHYAGLWWDVSKLAGGGVGRGARIVPPAGFVLERTTLLMPIVWRRPPTPPRSDQ